MNKRALGTVYESKGLDYLLRQGFELVDRNVYLHGCEIDLVMKKENLLYFVEVRYRSSAVKGSARESLSPKKKNRMLKGALQYLKMHDWKQGFRISLVSFQKEDMDFIESIFF